MECGISGHGGNRSEVFVGSESIGVPSMMSLLR